MTHAGSGHTDKVTINKRRPLTAGMRETLERMARRDGGFNGIACRHVRLATRNQIRALVERGYATTPGDFAYITDAGREALK